MEDPVNRLAVNEIENDRKQIMNVSKYKALYPKAEESLKTLRWQLVQKSYAPHFVEGQSDTYFPKSYCCCKLYQMIGLNCYEYETLLIDRNQTCNFINKYFLTSKLTFAVHN